MAVHGKAAFHYEFKEIKRKVNQVVSTVTKQAFVAERFRIQTLE